MQTSSPFKCRSCSAFPSVHHKMEIWVVTMSSFLKIICPGVLMTIFKGYSAWHPHLLLVSMSIIFNYLTYFLPKSLISFMVSVRETTQNLFLTMICFSSSVGLRIYQQLIILLLLIFSMNADLWKFQCTSAIRSIILGSAAV